MKLGCGNKLSAFQFGGDGGVDAFWLLGFDMANSLDGKGISCELSEEGERG